MLHMTLRSISKLCCIDLAEQATREDFFQLKGIDPGAVQCTASLALAPAPGSRSREGPGTYPHREGELGTYP